MKNNYASTQDESISHHSRSRFMGALILGGFAGVFVGLLAMAFAILMFGIVQLFFSDLAFQLAGMSITAVIFVIFCALGWIGSTMIFWRKLPTISSDS